MHLPCEVGQWEVIGGADDEAGVDQLQEFRLVELLLLLLVLITGEVVPVQQIGESLKIEVDADRCQVRCLARSYALSHGMQPLPQALGQR